MAFLTRGFKPVHEPVASDARQVLVLCCCAVEEVGGLLVTPAANL
jgi:hypothetical protein